jgi:hypothetical protein
VDSQNKLNTTIRLVLYNSEYAEVRVAVLSHGLGTGDIDEGRTDNAYSTRVLKAEIVVRKKIARARPYKKIEIFLLLFSQAINLKTSIPMIIIDTDKL